MNKRINKVLKLIIVLLILVTQMKSVEANDYVLSIQYPDGYSTGKLVYGWGSGNVCEDGKDHRLIRVGGENRFLGVFYLNGEVVYCIQPFVETQTGYKYTTSFDMSSLDPTVKNYLELASYFGYGYHSDYSMLSCIATQHAIWELQGTQVEDITPELRNRIDLIKQRVYDYVNKKKISFDGQTFTFDGCGKEHAITIIDTNHVIEDWILVSSSTGLHYEKINNTLKVWVDQPFYDEKRITFNLYDPTDDRIAGNSVLFINPNNAQKLASFADPIKRESNVSFVMASGDVEIQKYMNSKSDGSGRQDFEEGAEFIVMKEDNITKYGSIENAYNHKNEIKVDEYDYLTTNRYGYAKSKKLCAGIYHIRQVKGAVDTVIYDQPLSFEISEYNQHTVSFTLINNKFSSHLKIIKLDEEGNRIINNPMKFRIKDENGNFIQKEIDGKVCDEWNTNENGEIILPFKLDAGKYYLVESKAPIGFVVNENEIPFIITNASGNNINTTATIAEVNTYNKAKKGKIVIEKKFQETDRFIGDGVQFALYADVNIYNPSNHSILYKKGEQIGIYELPNNHILEINDLPIGYDDAIYKLKEIETYDNYQLDLKEYIFDFSNKDQYKAEIEKKITLHNQLLKINTFAMDHDDYDKTMYAFDNLKITDRVIYEGLRIGETYILEGMIYNKETKNPILDKFGNCITSKIEFEAKSINGEVFMDYELDGELIKKGTLVISTCLYNKNNEVLLNHFDLEDENQSISILPIYDFEIRKIDTDKKTLIQQPFTFTVFRDKECKTLLYVLDSNINGNIIWENVENGIYYLQETRAPKGYIRKDDLIKIEVNSAGIFINDKKIEYEEKHVIEIENEKIKIVKTGILNRDKANIFFLVFIFSLIIVFAGIYKKKMGQNIYIK